jgi:transcriptional regulator with XRE-family HTH domain
MLKMKQENDYSIFSQTEISNKEFVVPEVVYDFGALLRHLRINHGYSLAQVAKRLGFMVSKVSNIERSIFELPGEEKLKEWFMILGCGKTNANKLMLASRLFRVKHTFTLMSKETANPDILRILEYYKQGMLTDFDRRLLQLVARTTVLPQELKPNG